jgi:hypothetical protein
MLKTGLPATVRQWKRNCGRTDRRGSYPLIRFMSFKYGNAAVAARIRCSFQRAVSIANNSARMTHSLVEILQHLDFVTAAAQRFDDFRAEARLEFQ